MGPGFVYYTSSLLERNKVGDYCTCSTAACWMQAKKYYILPYNLWQLRDIQEQGKLKVGYGGIAHVETLLYKSCVLSWKEGKKWFSWNFNFVLAHRTSHSQATLPQVTLLSRTSMLNVHTSPLHKVEAKQMLCTSKQPCKIATIKISCTLQSPAFM